MFPCHGQCAVWLKLFNPAISPCNLGAKTRRRDAHIIDTECWCCALAVVFLAEVGRGFWLGLVRIWFALLASLHCLPAWFAALCLLSVVSALAGFIHLLVKGTLFWFVCCASRGHRFALGTGGLKQSLLVGGIGPVYSLPKLCFKPFRNVHANCSQIALEGTWIWQRN